MLRLTTHTLLGVTVTLLALAIHAPSAAANGILITPGSRGAARATRDGSPIRLSHHRVEATLRDHIAHVTVEHTFHSNATVPLEGTYLFPLPDGAVVSKFAMTMGGKMVQGEVLEAKAARAIYEGIVSRRQDPGLLEYMGRGLFRARVFPIPPRGDVRIRLSFQQVLRDDAGVLEFRYPLATERLNGAPVDQTDIQIRIESSVGLKGIYSPSHELPIQRDGDRSAVIHLEQKERRQRKDLLLYVSRSKAEVGLSVLSSKRVEENGTFVAVLAPPSVTASTAPTPKDVVFVLDTSGSMEGEKLTQARAAMAHGVRTLRDGDRFNLVAFASGTRVFRDGLVDASKEGKAAALAWITRQEAGGSTNISAALETALAMHTKERLSVVAFITDGEPTVGLIHPDSLVDLAKEANVGGARISTFGVGYDLDVALLDRIAAASGGTRDYIAPGENIEIVTSRFFRKLRHPVMTDVVLDLGGGVEDVYPSTIPDLFHGGQVVIYGRYKEAGPRTVTVRGTLGTESIERTYDLAFAATETHDFLPRLWANRKVMFLLDAVRMHGESKEVVDEIVKLATRHAIVTPYTAGLVVEENELRQRGRVTSANPLFQIGGKSLSRRRTQGSSGGPGGQYRGPGSSMPPSLREPTDPTPTPPPPSSGPATTPPPAPTPPTTPPASPSAPGAATRASKDLKRRKAASGELDDGGDRQRTASAAGKSFVRRADGRWVDTTWDGTQETVKLTAFSPAYFKLMEADARVAKYLAIGKRVVFVLGTVVYEITPAPKPTR